MKKNIFNSIQLTKPGRNRFDLTHDLKCTMDMGILNPILTLECIPGDVMTLSAESLIRFAPLIAPVMHRMDVTIHYFFVPNRLLWPNWENFITNSSIHVPPFINFGYSGFATVPDKFSSFFGVPLGGGGTQTADVAVSALPFAAYQMIWNEFYRDQNLIPPTNFQLTDGDNTTNGQLTIQRYRCWEHDYFTAALPFAQKGAAVDIPLGDVTLKNNWSASGIPEFRNTAGNDAGPGAVNQIAGQISVGTDVPAAYDPDGTLEVQPTTITDLRRAFKLQEWLEKSARAGSRYVENILAFFGVRSQDSRLQRPEYITGVKSPVIISEVLNSTGENGGLPQGNMAGHGFSVTTGKAGRYYCQEHGYIVGMMSVMPKTAYQQGIPRHLLKTDRFEYYWPQFAHIGEQPIYNDELYAYTSAGKDTFGYNPRYSEYKYMPSRVAGDFAGSLDYWHLGRVFVNPPALNQTFVEAQVDDRIFAVSGTGVDSLYIHVLNKIDAIRPMPVFGNPSM